MSDNIFKAAKRAIEKSVIQMGTFSGVQADKFMAVTSKVASKFGVSAFGNVVCDAVPGLPGCQESNGGDEDTKSAFGAWGDKRTTESFSAEANSPAPVSVAPASSSTTKVATENPYAWSRGSSNRLRKARWAEQSAANAGEVPKAPLTYQEAILKQPLPVLSPLRGSNQPQGVQAITDAAAGRSMVTYNPNAPPLAVAIPSNVTSGSLDADVKVNVVRSDPAVSVSSVAASATKSGFAAMFD